MAIYWLRKRVRRAWLHKYCPPCSGFIETGKLPFIDPQNDALWQKFHASDFDGPDADLNFTARLARVNSLEDRLCQSRGLGI